MKKLIMNKLIEKILFFPILIIFSSCGGDSRPGYEFMPNMYRSPSIETYGEHEIEGYNGMPVEGTISRGHLSTFNYDETLDGYIQAGEESTYPSEFLKDEKTLNEGKELYEMMCSHCHGIEGDGQGTIDHAVYSAVPSYKESDPKKTRRSGTTMSELKEGHIFHAITYGIKGKAMGPHSSQITEEERWKIVFYVKEKLQNQD